MFTLTELFTAFRNGNTRRSSVRTLNAMSAAQLADIGIPSDGIDAVVDAMLRQNAVAAAPGPKPAQRFQHREPDYGRMQSAG